MDELLLGKKAVILGGGGRIGSAIARSFLNNGAEVLLVDRNDEALQKVRESCLEDQQSICHLAFIDVDQKDRVENLALAIGKKLGRVDILVNCLGYIYRSTFIEHSTEELENLMKSNFTLVFAVSQRVAQMMVTQGSGKIINFSSAGGFRPEENHSGYCAAKAALIAFSQVIALELAEHHIQVNVVAPGPTETLPFTSSYYREHPEALRAIEEVTGRIGNPGDHTGLVLFLASSQSDWITGQVIASDGGWSLH